MANAHGSDYEIGYLIAPGLGLGGVESIHNLWPEPYTSRTWMRSLRTPWKKTPQRNGLGGWWGRSSYGTARHRHWLDCGL